MKSSFWKAFAAYLLPTFPLGYLWHLTIFKAQYESLGLYRQDVIIPLGLLSMLTQGILFAWMYPRLFSTARERWLASAARCAVAFGILAWSFTTPPVAAKYQMTSVHLFVVLESAFTVLQFVIVAPLMALAWRERS